MIQLAIHNTIYDSTQMAYVKTHNKMKVCEKPTVFKSFLHRLEREYRFNKWILIC